MNFELWNNRWRQTSDEEIERDVAELRRLLKEDDGPREPHPAYYQNFLVRVRGRIDEERFQRRRVAPSTVWATVSAAALVVVLVVGGVFAPSTPELAVNDRPASRKAAAEVHSGADTEPLFADARTQSSDLLTAAMQTPTYSDGTKSLVLNQDDVKMLNAIMSDDDNALFQAMVDSEGI